MASRFDWLKISGICGIVTPVVAFTCILLAIAYSPLFSWTGNALSDLGVQSGLTPILFNYGLAVSGVLAFVFAFGLFKFLKTSISGRVGAFFFVIAALALIAIGAFNENYSPTHWYVSLTFFVFSPLSMLLLLVAFLRLKQLKTGAFTFLTAMVAAVPWVAYFAVQYVEGVAIPETVSALAVSAWAVVLGFKMIKKAAQASTRPAKPFEFVKKLSAPLLRNTSKATEWSVVHCCTVFQIRVDLRTAKRRK